MSVKTRKTRQRQSHASIQAETVQTSAKNEGRSSLNGHSGVKKTLRSTRRGASRDQGDDCTIKAAREGGQMKDKKQLTDEEKLDAGIFELFGPDARSYRPDLWQNLRENMRVTVLYPGKHVVFRDYWEGEGDALRLIQRKVLFDSSDREKARDFLDKVIDATPLHEQPDLGLTFVEAGSLVKIETATWT
jgi:hypothetical protein